MQQTFRAIPASVGPVVVLGCGYLGRAVTQELHRQNVVVRAYSKSGAWSSSKDDSAISPRRPAHLELGAIDFLQAQPDQLREVLNGARQLLLCYSSGGNAENRRPLFVELPRRLAEVADTKTLERVIAISSTSALPDLDQVLDESCPVGPSHERGQIQREAEIEIVRAFGEKSIDWCILRLAGLYGPGRPLGRIYRASAPSDGSIGVRQSGDGWTATNLIHRDDARNAVLEAIVRPSLRNTLIHVCDDDHRPRREMIDNAALQRGEALPEWEFPRPDGPIRGKQVCNKRMKSELGLILSYPTHVVSDLASKVESGGEICPNDETPNIPAASIAGMTRSGDVP